jgi:hypothetical protein
LTRREGGSRVETHPVTKSEIERRILNFVVVVGEGGDELVEDLLEEEVSSR